MTKSEIIAAVAEKASCTKKDAEKYFGAVIDTITEALTNGEKVSITGFGTFEVRDRAAKDAINPATKEPIHVPAKKVPAFKAGKALKEAVDK
ncbi:MAG: HU family DNA-binding protein, partial [Ruminococcus sp.]|nr:HU family DNA-binding protein [Ruminococcus sp.]